MVAKTANVDKLSVDVVVIFNVAAPSSALHAELDGYYMQSGVRAIPGACRLRLRYGEKRMCGRHPRPLIDNGGLNGAQGILQSFFGQCIDVGREQFCRLYRAARQIVAIELGNQAGGGAGHFEQGVTLFHEQFDFRSEHADFVLVDGALHGGFLWFAC